VVQDVSYITILINKIKLRTPYKIWKKKHELLPEPPTPRTALPLPLKLLRHPRPSLAAPPSTLPCCTTLDPPLLLHQK
jgi:hypothetical protein